MRMSMLRFTMLTNGFQSESREPHLPCGASYIHITSAGFPRTLRVTPAREAGITDHVWSSGVADLSGIKMSHYPSVSLPFAKCAGPRVEWVERGTHI